MNNPYIGFSENELRQKIKWEQDSIESELHWITSLEEKIAQHKQTIEVSKRNIKLMKDAMKYSETIAYETFMRITKDTRSHYIGPANVTYYSSVYYKDYVAYNIEVFKANAMDWTKSRTQLASKEVEASYGREYLREQILNFCVQYDVHKLLLKDVKINLKEIQKVYPYLEVAKI